MTTPARSPGAVQRSLTDRLGARAKAAGQNVNRVRRQFVMSRLLTRVFGADPDGWSVKGGRGMMVRLRRFPHSEELDRMVSSAGAGDAIAAWRCSVGDY